MKAVIIGPNGCGKAPGHAIMGREDIEVEGKLQSKIIRLETHERARQGLFVSWQTLEILVLQHLV